MLIFLGYTVFTHLEHLRIKIATSCEKQDIRMEDTLKQTQVAIQGRCEAHENGPNTARTTLKLNNVQMYLR